MAGMEFDPEDLTPDALRALRAEEGPEPGDGSPLLPRLEPEDRAFLDRILGSLTRESQVLITALHPDGRFQYLLLNANTRTGLHLLAKVAARLAQLDEQHGE